MAKLTEGDRDRLALATVNLILEVRRMYLDRFPRSVLKHWTQIGNAVVEVTMTNASVPEWTTALLEALRLPAPSKAYSAMTLALAQAVTSCPGGAAVWLAWLGREHGFVMATARVRSEEAAEKKRAERAAREVLSLPMGPHLEDAAVERVIREVRKFCDRSNPS